MIFYYSNHSGISFLILGSTAGEIPIDSSKNSQILHSNLVQIHTSYDRTSISRMHLNIELNDCRRRPINELINSFKMYVYHVTLAQKFF